MVLPEMANIFFVLIFTCLKIKYLQGQLIHTFGDGNATWTNASTVCALATPRIEFTNGEMIAVFEGETINMTEGEDAWLGYVLDSVILQNVGCMKYDVDKEPRLATYYDTGADPGICFSACREKGYFGLMKTKCFCFGNVPTLPADAMFETSCRQPCTKLDDEASCGGNNVVSLYKQADGLSASDVTDFPISRNSGNCILYDRNTKTFYATKCTMAYRIGCQRMSGEVVDMSSRTVNWMEMTGYCSSQKLYPYTYTGVLDDSGDYVFVWTGMIKARKLYKKNQGSNQPLAIAYVRVVNGRHKLRFANPASSAVKRFICQEGEEITTEPTYITTEIPDFKTKASTQVEEANLLPLFIIIPIVLILVAIIVILLFIRWRRKKRNKELKSKNLMKNPSGKAGKRRKRSLTEGSHLSNDTARMYEMTDSDPPVIEWKTAKRNSNFSNNLIASISLENVVIENDAFIDDTDDTNEQSETTASAKDGSKTGSTDKHEVNENGNVTNKNDGIETSDPPAKYNIRDDPKVDNEYARINKKPKPSKDADGKMYDKLGEGMKENDIVKLETNYDKAVFNRKDPDLYDTTSKPVNFPHRDQFYDGLHRF